MPYSKTNWQNGITEFNADTMNNIEDGVEEAVSLAEQASGAVGDKADLDNSTQKIKALRLSAGEGSGGVALTINDGYGNANIAFNHTEGTPAQDGNSARISVNTDSSVGANMAFSLGSGVAGGSLTTLTEVLKLTESGASIFGNDVYHKGDFSIEHPACSLSAGRCCMQDSGGSFIASQRGMYVSNGTHAIGSGGVCVLTGLAVGFNYYAQTDGSISTSPSSYKVGYAVSSTKLLVQIQGQYGVDEEYTGLMQAFYPMPSVSGEIRLKVQMPTDADGVMIRGDVVPYDGSGIAWGYHTVTITDDSDYYGNNKWYSNVGLTNGTKYYYKAFPYKGTTYNETQGVNECEVTCRYGLAEWTMDSLSGSNILDTFNSYHLVYYNTAFGQLVIDNGGTFSNGYAYRDKFLPSSWISFHAMISFGNTDVKYLFGENIDVNYVDYGWGFGIDANGDIFLNTNRVNQILFSTGLQVNTTYSLGITFNRSTGQAQVYVNGVLIGTKTVTLPDMSNVLKFYLGATYLAGGNELQKTGHIKMDQVRIYSAQLPTEDFALLYRGGAGC